MNHPPSILETTGSSCDAEADDDDELIAADPDTYYLKPHYEDHPCVLVRLSRIQPDALRDLLRMGWEFARSRAKRKSQARPAERRHP
jgi:hypothetical protein